MFFCCVFPHQEIRRYPLPFRPENRIYSLEEKIDGQSLKSPFRYRNMYTPPRHDPIGISSVGVAIVIQAQVIFRHTAFFVLQSSRYVRYKPNTNVLHTISVFLYSLLQFQTHGTCTTTFIFYEMYSFFIVTSCSSCFNRSSIRDSRGLYRGNKE